MLQRSLLLVTVVASLTGCPEKCTTGTCESDGGAAAGGGAATGGGPATGGGSANGGGAATGGGSATVDAGPALALTDFCAAYPAAACAHFAACGLYESATSATCLAAQSVATLCAQSLSGTTHYDGVQGQRCLDELSRTPLTCYTDFPACGNLNGSGREVLGTVFTTLFGQCLGVSCDGGACDDSCTGPSCQPFKQLGESCNESGRPFARCASSSWCGSTDGGPTTCQPFLGAGADCSSAPCGSTSFCNFQMVPPKCETRRADGVACQFGSQCAANICQSNGTCGGVDAGAACRSPADCGDFQSPIICVGLTRFADGGVTPGTCAPRPSRGQACSYAWANGTDPCHAELGEGCIEGTCRYLEPFTFPVGTECPVRPYGRVELPFFAFASCLPNLRCLPSTTANAPRTGRCADPLVDGAPCRDSFWCTPGSLCMRQVDGGDGCQRPSQLGGACPGNQCRFDAVCGDGGVCVRLPRAGESCAGFSGCEIGTQCDGQSCVALAGADAGCSYDFQCASGVCQAGACVAMCIR